MKYYILIDHPEDAAVCHIPFEFDDIEDAVKTAEEIVKIGCFYTDQINYRNVELKTQLTVSVIDEKDNEHFFKRIKAYDKFLETK